MSPASHVTTVILAKPMECACGGQPEPVDGKQKINGRYASKTFLRCPLCWACGPMTDTHLDAQKGWNGVRHAQIYTHSTADELDA